MNKFILAAGLALLTATSSAQTPPEVSLSANPSIVTAGEPVTLTWNSSGASSCIGNGFSTNGNTSGMATVFPTVTTTYSITCQAAIQNAANVTVTPVTPPPPPPPPPPPGSNPCGKQMGGPAVFCETFAASNPGIPSRTGGLDPNVWGVSRLFDFNLGQGIYNGWAPTTQLQTCNGTITVSAPNDIVVCNNQLRESSNDNPQGCLECGGVTGLMMYPKQPFDFAAMPGVISFDVSNDSHGSHSAWPELWVTDLPVPPFMFEFAAGGAIPQNGFVLRFHASGDVGDQSGACPTSANINFPRWSLGAAAVIRNYVVEDTQVNATNLNVNLIDCVIAPPDGSGIMNHVEIKIVSKDEIDVYASDAGNPTSLRLINTITGANLPLTRGLVWFEDVHYNADKGGLPSQRSHTFVWGNLAFDGPFAGRDFAYDALDQADPDPQNFEVNLGQVSDFGSTATWNVLGLPANRVATAVRVLFNFYAESQVNSLIVIVNGHRHDIPWPFPAPDSFDVKTLAVTVPLSDLVTGTNVVQLGSDQPLVTMNVDIVLAGVPGAVPVQPGSVNTYPH